MTFAATPTTSRTHRTGDLAAIAEMLRDSTVHVRNGRMGGGSGVIWGASGLVVTNAHVTQSAKPTVELRDGRTFDADILAVDEHRDLAALQIDAIGLPAITPGNSNALRPGQIVVAVGNPLGLSGAVTFGVVHTAAHLSPGNHQIWVQADVDLAPGNSGGPLADVRGHVIGINSMVAGELALAVPSNEVAAFLARKGAQPFIGLTTQHVAVQVGENRRSGLLVLQTEPGSPAESSGIILGDIVIGAGGIPFAGPGDLEVALRAVHPGSALRLDILRGGIHRESVVVADTRGASGKGAHSEAA